MAVRQYIGARYTIKIYENSLDPTSAEWESGFAYEYLTLVTVNNDVYLSRKDVPSSVGTPSANGEYWVQMGNFNGQVANLQSQIDNITSYLDDNGLETLDTIAQHIVGAINEVNSNVGSLASFISGLNGNYIISDIKEVVATSDGTDTNATLYDKLVAAACTALSAETDKIVCTGINDPSRGIITMLFRKLYDPTDFTDPTSFPHMHAITHVFSAGTTLNEIFLDLRETGDTHYVVLSHQIVNNTWVGTNVMQDAYQFPAGTEVKLYYVTLKEISLT